MCRIEALKSCCGKNGQPVEHLTAAQSSSISRVVSPVWEALPLLFSPVDRNQHGTHPSGLTVLQVSGRMSSGGFQRFEVFTMKRPRHGLIFFIAMSMEWLKCG